MIFSAIKLIAYDTDFHNKEFEKLGVDDMYGKAFANELDANLINFYKGKELLNESYYSQKEIIHLNDLKRINANITIIIYVLLILSLVCIFLLKMNSFKPIIIGSAALILFFIIISLINFDSLFTSMHLALFSNDFWLLDPAESVLVNVYPFGFFQDAMKKVALTSIFHSIVIILASITSLKLQARFKNKKAA